MKTKQKDPAAVALGRKGGLASSGIKNLPKKRRREIARKAGLASAAARARRARAA